MNRFQLKVALAMLFVVSLSELGIKFFTEIKEQDRLQVQRITNYEREVYKQCKLMWPKDYEERC